MKQYIMGMLTGASLILCAVMFMGASYNDGKFQLKIFHEGAYNESVLLFNTHTGALHERTENEKGFTDWVLQLKGK